MANLPHVASIGLPESREAPRESADRGLEYKFGGDREQHSMNPKSLIALWRSRAGEAREQLERMQEGSVSQEMMLTIAETYERLARWEERHLPRDLPTLPL